MNDSGNRDEWVFEYPASELAKGARAQLEFRQGRLQVWKDAKTKLMAEIRESGLEIDESLADNMAAAGQLSYSTRSAQGPRVVVNKDYQSKLNEAFGKINHHSAKVQEYEAWVQVFEATPQNKSFNLNQADWMFFFGKTP